MNEQILVVDDEKEIADLVEVYLKNEGYQVFKFYNARDAQSCVNTYLPSAYLSVLRYHIS